MNEHATAWGVLIGIAAVCIVVLNTFCHGWNGPLGKWQISEPQRLESY